MSKINIRDLDLYYNDFHALKNINMNIKKNEITASEAAFFLYLAVRIA